MNIVRIRRKLESETLYLPELKPLIGKTVAITVEESPPITTADSPYEAFFSLAGTDAVDPEAYKSLRAASMI